ncbi:MAG: NADH-quinone oxidoreductase subunit H [Lachnospiraceae bacterium]|nr:NADH-quinone oxidoreductase subunit H [Lachnospiraceae bacterium]
MSTIIFLIRVVGIIVLAPIVGGLLSGLDRIISARMQGRKGPPILQPFYDVIKLFQKESIEVNRMHRFYVYISLFFGIFTTVIILIGGDILLAMFTLTLGSIFFILGGYAASSAYSFIGAERELLQMMAYEPMVLLVGAGLYYASGSFFVKDIIRCQIPAIIYLPGIFLGLVFVLIFKLRKSPFDLSMSHHGEHQEIVQGISTEYSGRELAVIELTHWYETIFAFSLVYMFFTTVSPFSHIASMIVCMIVYLFEILVDNAFARVKWDLALKLSWIVTGVLGTVNLIVLSFFK